MRTIGSAFAKQAKDSENNFLILRLFAATLVVFGHSAALAKQMPGYVDLFYMLTGYRYSGDIGLHIFFVISGFLVFASYDNRRDLMTYLRARILRIFPGLLGFVFVVAIVLGAAITTLDISEYYVNPWLWKYVFVNLSLSDFVWALPGVINGASISGTLWTLGIEFRLYLLVGLFGVLGVSLGKIGANACVLLLASVAFFYPAYMPVIGYNPDALRVSCFFAAGALLYINRNAVPLNSNVLSLLLFLTILSHKLPSFEIMCGVTLVYSVFLFAFAPKIQLPRFIEDFSYGIYLYGWPVQVLINYIFPDAGPYRMMLISIPASWILGALSWHLIEKKCLSFKIFKKPKLSTTT